MNWVHVEDGEYNEKYATYRRQKITIYSDRDGLKWSYIINDEVDTYNNYDDEDVAIQEAIDEVDLREDIINASSGK